MQIRMSRFKLLLSCSCRVFFLQKCIEAYEYKLEIKRLKIMNKKNTVDYLNKQCPELPVLLEKITQAGGQAFLVGGAVRDMVLDIAIKDIDIEVHGLELERLKTILEQHGKVSHVGKSFGVLKFHKKIDIDWSLPRTDSAGRKPEVKIDPTMTIEEALKRRDLTMNALAFDLVTGELHDPFDGCKDIKDKILRCTDEKFFIEDPLRFFRVMQFIGRFEMQPSSELQKLCKSMDISQVSRERIEEEFKKLLLKSDTPSRGIRWLHEIGRLKEVLPELAETVGVEQSAQWHPEGDVFTHTMQVIDAAVDVGRQLEEEQEKIVLMYAAICHDLGKPDTTVKLKDGRISSRGHEDVGVPIAKKLLTRICGNKKIIQTVAKLVKFHMTPGSFIKNNARKAAYKRLALKLASETNCYKLALLCEADKRGRNGESNAPLSGPIKDVMQFVAQAEEAGVLYGPEPAVLAGKDLIDIVKPGPKLGELVKKAYRIQINEGVTDKDTLKKRILN